MKVLLKLILKKNILKSNNMTIDTLKQKHADEKIQYWNPYKNKWVDKLPKKFINRLVKTRWVEKSPKKTLK